MRKREIERDEKEREREAQLNKCHRMNKHCMVSERQTTAETKAAVIKTLLDAALNLKHF